MFEVYKPRFGPLGQFRKIGPHLQESLRISGLQHIPTEKKTNKTDKAIVLINMLRSSKNWFCTF